MLDPLLYRWGVPPVVIRCVHWTMQMWVLETWIKALGLYIVMFPDVNYTCCVIDVYLSNPALHGYSICLTKINASISVDIVKI